VDLVVTSGPLSNIISFMEEKRQRIRVLVVPIRAILLISHYPSNLDTQRPIPRVIGDIEVVHATPIRRGTCRHPPGTSSPRMFPAPHCSSNLSLLLHLKHFRWQYAAGRRSRDGSRIETNPDVDSI
jgi:hypothetical protein